MPDLHERSRRRWPPEQIGRRAQIPVGVVDVRVPPDRWKKRPTARGVAAGPVPVGQHPDRGVPQSWSRERAGRRRLSPMRREINRTCSSRERTAAACPVRHEEKPGAPAGRARPGERAYSRNAPASSGVGEAHRKTCSPDRDHAVLKIVPHSRTMPRAPASRRSDQAEQRRIGVPPDGALRGCSSAQRGQRHDLARV